MTGKKKQAPQLDDAALEAVRGGAQFNPKEIKISQSVPWKPATSARPAELDENTLDAVQGGGKKMMGAPKIGE